MILRRKKKDIFHILNSILGGAWPLDHSFQLRIQRLIKRWINPRHVLADAFTKTLSVDLAVFRGVVTGVARELGFSLGRGFIDLPHVSVHRRMSAIQLGWPAAISVSVTANLAKHFAQKPLRRTVDMARKVGDLVDIS